MENIHNKTLEKAKKYCIELLQYRIVHHVEVVKDTEKEVWCLVLRDWLSKGNNDLKVGTILCCTDDRQKVSEKKTDISDSLSEGLLLVHLDKETKEDLYYVLPYSGEIDKVMHATSTDELDSHAKVLCVTKGQDPLEPVSCEILKRCFGINKNTCSSNAKHCSVIELVKTGDIQKLKELQDVESIKCACDEMKWTMLHHAAYYGNFEMLSFLISIGCDVRAQDICGRSPMHIAAREGYTDAIRLFLHNSASINERDVIGWTLLHYAAWKGCLETVRFLIQNES